MLANPRATHRAAFCEAIRPDPLMTVSQWSDRFRMLSSKAAAEPGRWRTDRTPYLREIMDCLSVTSPIEEVVFIKGAQVGGTECGNNWIGYIIDYAPAPTMAVQPTVDLAKRNSKQRIAPLIEESPRLVQKVAAAKSRDSKNTLLEKDFPGGRLVMAGANSAVALRSMPAKNLFLDEEDGYPDDLDGEGDPTELARARTRTFARRKIFRVSTPTFAGRSKIEKGYQASDMRRFFVPCPLCDHFQHLRWGQVRWPDGHPELAVYACEACEKEIPEHHKTKMLARGQWRAERPGAQAGKVAGFHLNSLYSPLGWFSWGDAAKSWESAQKNPEKLKTFVNTVLGETWAEKGDAPDWEKLFLQRETFPIGQVPTGGVFLTAGVDVQKDRLEVEVVAWGRDKQSWSVDYRVFLGDTATDEPWRDLDRILSHDYPRAGGTGEDYLRIRLMAVDTGYNTQHVYTWCRRHSISRVVPVKGRSNLPVPVGQPSALDVTTRGKRKRRGVRVWPVGVDHLKAELYSWLKLPKPTEEGKPYPAGYLHFPEYGPEHFQMLTAEQIVVRFVRGYRKYLWEKIRDRNEALDCRVYARAAANIVGLDRFTPRQWDELAGQSGARSAPPVPQAEPEEDSDDGAQAVQEEAKGPTPPVRKRSRVRGSFLT